MSADCARRLRHAAAPVPTDGGPLARLTDALAPHGGMLEADLLTDTMRQDHGQPVSVLSRWIVGRRALAMRACASLRVPLFQFLPDPFRPHPVVEGVLLEFEEVLDDWEIAFWFVTPNASLGGMHPIRALRSDPERLLDVARLDRFVARG